MHERRAEGELGSSLFQVRGRMGTGLSTLGKDQIRFLSLSLFLLYRQHLSTSGSVRPGSSSNRPFLPSLAHPFR